MPLNERKAEKCTGFGIRWEWFVTYMPSSAAIDHAREGRHSAFVREFASAVSIFQDRTEALIDMYEAILGNIDELAKCAYTAEAFSDILARIQKTVRLFTRSFMSNVRGDACCTDRPT